MLEVLCETQMVDVGVSVGPAFSGELAGKYFSLRFCYFPPSRLDKTTFHNLCKLFVVVFVIGRMFTQRSQLE